MNDENILCFHLWVIDSKEPNTRYCGSCGHREEVPKLEPKYPLLAAIHNACEKLGM